MSFMSKDNSAVEPRFGSSLRAQQPDIVTTFGSGMLVTGNVVCAGAVQIFGRVLGDIRAAHLIIGQGAYVEGTVTARDAVVQGTFKGTLYANAVKLQGEARVDGEVYNKSLSIEPNVVFEGSSRRLEKAVDAPSVGEANGQPAAALPPVDEPLDLVPQQFAELPGEVDNDVLA
ncbi:MAG: polymer-forming cytoskeletal protein [Proteobacteria bacterium]|nr:polymer-forming cytoskeletal protein [Pseudomonadota bacterium]